MAFAVGQTDVRNPANDLSVAVHVLGNLEEVAAAADAREEDATNDVIAVLREALFQSNETNQALRARLALEAGRVNVLENRVSNLTTQHLDETRALQQKIDALESRAKADATENAALKATIEAHEKKIEYLMPMYNHPGVRAFMGILPICPV